MTSTRSGDPAAPVFCARTGFRGGPHGGGLAWATGVLDGHCCHQGETQPDQVGVYRVISSLLLQRACNKRQLASLAVFFFFAFSSVFTPLATRAQFVL